MSCSQSAGVSCAFLRAAVGPRLSLAAGGRAPRLASPASDANTAGSAVHLDGVLYPLGRACLSGTQSSHFHCIYIAKMTSLTSAGQMLGQLDCVSSAPLRGGGLRVTELDAGSPASTSGVKQVADLKGCVGIPIGSHKASSPWEVH